MKFTTSTQVRYFPYGEHFEEEINEYLASVHHPKIVYLEHAAIVECVLEVYIPETVAEQAEVEGCAHNCGECPYFAESTDKRTKWHKCTLKNKKVRKESLCCDEYYERSDDVSKNHKRDEKTRVENPRTCRGSQGKRMENVQPIIGAIGIHEVGTRSPCGVFRNQ